MTILLILLIFLAIVGIRLYKVWKDAGYLEETVDLQHFSYEVELKLDKKKLSSSLTGTLDAIAEITGLEEKDVYHLKIKGSVYGEVIHAEIYPYSSKAPITDIYLGKNGNVINGATIYNAMRKEFVEGDDRLEELLPEWEGAEYMTADQLGLMLEANLKDISRFSLKTEKLKLSKTQYLIALAVMKKEKSRKIHYIYEEMISTINDMVRGIPEAEAYERFGRRLQLLPYMKLSAMLSQNLKKGNKRLIEQLRLTSIDALIQRRDTMKQLGEEASSKLLFPMMLQFMLILIIVMVPAIRTM